MKMKISNTLAIRLSQWHGSMSDPIYSVSSRGIAGIAIDVDTFRLAIESMRSRSGNPGFDEYKNEIVEIVQEMESCLSEPDAIRPVIISAMARFLWSSAWAEWIEDNDRSSELSGGEILAMAPDTGAEAIAKAEELLYKFEELNSVIIEHLFVDFNNREYSCFEYGYELAASISGCGDDGEFDNLKMPYWENVSLFHCFEDEDEE